MPPPHATCRALVREFCGFDAEVGCERAPTLAPAMRAHRVGADVMEDTDEVRGRIRLLSRLARFPSRCQPPGPGFLCRVVDPFRRQSQRRRVRDLREHAHQHRRHDRVAGHANLRLHATANACGAPRRFRDRAEPSSRATHCAGELAARSATAGRPSGRAAAADGRGGLRAAL
jgi:hypothetical protein